jgi:aldose 1-epimerase
VTVSPAVAPVSGTQHVLRAGSYEAIVASIGASLRALTVDGRDLVVPFDADEVRPGFRGTTLAPWPNRVVDGRYVFDGVEYELALTEPRRGHALHGLRAWADYTAVDKGPSHVTLQTVIPPQTGYPWRVVVETTYSLTADGLTQSVRARNDGATRAPWGTGPHPYLVAGDGALDDWTLELPASRVLEVTPDRLAPTVLAPVESDAARFDFRVPRTLGDVEIDHAYTGLSRDADGTATVTLRAGDGGVRMSWGEACAWVQVHTADLPGGPGTPGHRAGLAVEPMTCAPDAFNADRYDIDTGLLVIEPGAWSPTASWSIAAL